MKTHLGRRTAVAVGLALLVLAFAFARAPSHSEARSLSDDPTLLSHTVSAGEYHTCGVRTDGTLACWGDDSQGQATPPAGTFSQVSAGGYHTCGLMTDGTLACWGMDIYGQATPPTGTFSQVSAGFEHTCGVRTDGTLACWGFNSHGQATPLAGTFSQVSAGGYHTCGVRTDGTPACWGWNGFGQARPCVFPDDADCDACWDSVEPTLSPPADPSDPWDWYDVPVPTLFSDGHINGDPSGTDDRDHAITIIDDLLAVLEYSGTSDGGLPNAGGRQYNQDVNLDGVDDGIAYDRTVGATRSGAPDGAVSIIVDVLLVLEQSGYSCGSTPP